MDVDWFYIFWEAQVSVDILIILYDKAHLRRITSTCLERALAFQNGKYHVACFEPHHNVVRPRSWALTYISQANLRPE